MNPPRLKCTNCNGKKWFPSAIGLIACQRCDGTGLGPIDVDRLVKEWTELKTKLKRYEKLEIQNPCPAVHTGLPANQT